LSAAARSPSAAAQRTAGHQEPTAATLATVEVDRDEQAVTIAMRSASGERFTASLCRSSAVSLALMLLGKAETETDRGPAARARLVVRWTK
jgi:hypothetical protein